MTIPHWAPPTHAMQIWRYAEQGSIELLWISATNPAVSLPDLARIRRILARDGAVRRRPGPLPDRDRRARRRGAARGDLGREDRHVHQRRPHRPPVRAGGRAARRGPRRPRHLPRLRAAHGLPRPRRRPADHLARPRGARSRRGRPARAGRPCDYTGITYERLRGAAASSGRAPRRRPTAPSGSTRDGVFNTDPDYCETFGQDLVTGAAPPSRSTGPSSRAGGRSCRPPTTSRRPRSPSDEYPLLLTTGRTVYQFHTRTKTGRAPELDAAAPDAWVELSAADAAALGVAEGDLVRVESARGAIEAPARV